MEIQPCATENVSLENLGIMDTYTGDMMHMRITWAEKGYMAVA